jgi:hypothetical protein
VVEQGQVELFQRARKGGKPMARAEVEERFKKGRAAAFAFRLTRLVRPRVMTARE